MKFYKVEEDTSLGFTGRLDAVNKWCLPGVEPCPKCRLGGGVPWLAYPCVDLSGLPPQVLRKLKDPWPVPFEEFSRLRELVRPLAPSWALLEPGAQFGPYTGKGSGSFGGLFMQDPFALFLRRGALDELRAEGVRGLDACPVEIRFRGANPPELLQLQLQLQGRLHVDVRPSSWDSPCASCGRVSASWPKDILLDSASLPEDVDVFRHREGWATLIVTERFVEAVRRLDLGGVIFRELAVR
ncbi:double-CXXCG motif protein [Myxococcus faecalis]|uniref:SitI6 family double-CXXCG motif immunity protein n=1 Tax=Myxococcus faecalis TaxID=3115646 RepID=UPI003CECC58F